LPEVFAALDAAGGAEKPAWIHAGAHHAEAGYEDPALGWVSVRADLGGGVVHAALVAGSADAAQTLGTHLAGLNDYLAQRHPSVETVTVAAPESGWGDKSMGQQMQQGTGQQSGQQPDRNGPPVLAASQPDAPARGAPILAGSSGALNERARAGGGAHISVMA
jgi:hypothetical protein